MKSQRFRDIAWPVRPAIGNRSAARATMRRRVLLPCANRGRATATGSLKFQVALVAPDEIVKRRTTLEEFATAVFASISRRIPLTYIVPNVSRRTSRSGKHAKIRGIYKI